MTRRAYIAITAVLCIVYCLSDLSALLIV